MIMAQTPVEKLVTELNIKFEFISAKLNKIEEDLSHKPGVDTMENMVVTAIQRHVIDCVNQKKKPSIPPKSLWSGVDDKTKSRLFNAIILVLSVAAGAIAMKFGIGA